MLGTVQIRAEICLLLGHVYVISVLHLEGLHEAHLDLSTSTLENRATELLHSSVECMPVSALEKGGPGSTFKATLKWPHCFILRSGQGVFLGMSWRWCRLALPVQGPWRGIFKDSFRI